MLMSVPNVHTNIKKHPKALNFGKKDADTSKRNYIYHMYCRAEFNQLLDQTYA